MPTHQPRIIFRTANKTGCINLDGSDPRTLEFDVPGQETWSAVGSFADGRRLLLSSMEARQDGPGRPYSDYIHLTRVHMWIYDLDSGKLAEIEDDQRTEPFTMPLLVFPDQQRILFQIGGKGTSRIFSMTLDGKSCQELTQGANCFPYGFVVSPCGTRVAFHVSGPAPHAYRIFTSNLDGADKTLVAEHPRHYCFGPAWSKDGGWLLYCDIEHYFDPGHDSANLYIARPDGTEGKALTSGAPHWMSATWGNPANRGGGSNMPRWLPNGTVLYSRKTANAVMPWQFDDSLPDDHFQRAYRPESACGGAALYSLNPDTGAEAPITTPTEGVWDFRALPSPDGKHIVFCRATIGEPPALWLADSDGANQRQLTRGFENTGAEHPLWLPGSADKH